MNGQFRTRNREEIKADIAEKKNIRHKDMHTRNHESTLKRLEAVLKMGEGSPLDEILKEIDKTLSVHLFDLRKEIMATLTVLEEKVRQIEEYAKSIFHWHSTNQDQVFKDARHLVDLERKEKAVLCQWLNGFIVHCDEEPALDPVDFSFSRFALNIAAASYTTTDPSKMISAGVPAFLVGILSQENDIVRGPAALALSHLALHDQCKQVIAHENGIPPLIENSVNSQSPAVLIQGCKALAILALQLSNKPIIAQRGGLAALIDIIEEGNIDLDEGVPRVSPEVSKYALTALVNSIYQSDANRTLAVELGVMEPLVTCLEKSDADQVLLQAVRVLGNVAYGNSYTATKLLHARADTVLAEVISTCDLRAPSTTSNELLEGALLSISNLSNHEMNQSQLGGSGCLGVAIKVLRHGQDPNVLRSAALALGSMAYKSLLNKTRMGDQGAVQTLLETAERMDADQNSTFSMEMRGQAAVACCCALSQILTHPPNQITMRDINGYVRLIELCENTEHMGTLEAAAMALTALVPDCDEKVRMDNEGRGILVEEAGGLDALVRCKQWVYGRKELPEWLATAIDTLQSSPKDLSSRMRGDFYHRPEIFTQHFLYQEMVTELGPDLAVSTSSAIQELVYRIY